MMMMMAAYGGKFTSEIDGWIDTYYSVDRSRTMDLVSDIERTAAAASCYGAFSFCGGWEMPYHCFEIGMVDDFGGGEGHDIV